MSQWMETLSALLRQKAASGNRPAFLAPGREPLRYDELLDLIERTGRRLRALGLGPGARIAVVLPNGPELASAFLALASCSACAPLNPALRRADFEFALGSLRADALLVEEEGANGPAAAAARALGVRILRLRRGGPAGWFELLGADGEEALDWPAPDGTALLLHTSGTTSRPKLVPLSAANLCASARHIAASLALSPEDRCLNILPLFHIHGLAAAVLATLASGGSVVLTDGVYAAGFFDWLEEFRPTWYTAVPTMHQGILARAGEHRALLAELRLRFVRSSSAPLPKAVAAALEDAFEAPVIEAYGMTEAAHQIASNPLPPGRRKFGSVGLPAGPDIAVLSPDGKLLPAGETGEVVIRGPNVTAGYEGNDQANAEAFVDGWFRTGDLGRFDEDGYLNLAGRLKELINRGGEKISPREIDEVLMEHPAVRQAVAFAIPHAQLGEEVAAAVELRPGADVDERSLREWAAARLPVFKVPRAIRIVDEIPKGPTGKLQRNGLAAQLGLGATPAIEAHYVAPRNPLEQRIAAVWRELLPGRPVGVRTPFEDLGGDSLLAMRMLAAVAAREGQRIPETWLLGERTIEALAAALQAPRAGPLVCLAPGGSRPPLYAVPGHEGVLTGLANLARELGPEQPFRAFDINRLEAEDIDALAGRCAELMLETDKRGAYRLLGVCFGGYVAAKLAEQLVNRGHLVEFLAIIDAMNPRWRRDLTPRAVVSAYLGQIGEKLRGHRQLLKGRPPAAVLSHLMRRSLAFVQNHMTSLMARLPEPAVTSAVRHRRMVMKFQPRPLPVDLLLFRLPGRRPAVPMLGWQGFFARIELLDLDFDPRGALTERNLARLAAALARRLG